MDILPGNCLPLKNIPLGKQVHKPPQLRPGKGGQIARSAGLSVQVVAKRGRTAQVKMRCPECGRLNVECLATIGAGRQRRPRAAVSIGKAGAGAAGVGKRPQVRGVAMNPVDHPLGGGEGKTSGGRPPVSPWGMPTKGYKTRNSKSTDRFIVQRRKNSLQFPASSFQPEGSGSDRQLVTGNW